MDDDDNGYGDDNGDGYDDCEYGYVDYDDYDYGDHEYCDLMIHYTKHYQVQAIMIWQYMQA